MPRILPFATTATTAVWWRCIRRNASTTHAHGPAASSLVHVWADVAADIVCTPFHGVAAVRWEQSSVAPRKSQRLCDFMAAVRLGRRHWHLGHLTRMRFSFGIYLPRWRLSAMLNPTSKNRSCGHRATDQRYELASPHGLAPARRERNPATSADASRLVALSASFALFAFAALPNGGDIIRIRADLYCPARSW